MPIQMSDFANILSRDPKPKIDLMQSMMEAYKPQQAQADIGLKEAQTEKARDLAGNFTGTMGNINIMQKLRQKAVNEGRDPATDENILELQKSMDLDNDRQKQTMEWQKSLIESQGKRVATKQGKTAMEEEDINAVSEDAPFGVYPSTNKPIESKEKQDELRGQYENIRFKEATDTKNADRVLMSKNLEKTLDSVNVDEAFSYSGLGGIQKKIDQGLDLLGGEAETYQRYKEQTNKLKLLSKQLRMTFGDSVSPRAAQALDQMSNPESWGTSPATAKRMFNTTKRILKDELSTFQSALKSPSVYHSTPPVRDDVTDFVGVMEANKPQNKGTSIGITPDGRRVSVKVDLMEEFISNGGKRG